MPYPLPQPGGNGDVLTGAMLASGICAALLRRERTGRTAVVDASLLGTGVWMMMLSLTAAASGQRFNAQSLADRTQLNNPLVNIFRTRDDRYIGFAMPQSDKDWPEVCDVPRSRRPRRPAVRHDGGPQGEHGGADVSDR